MREFHTQLAQKEQELEIAVKETIGKENFKFRKEQAVSAETVFNLSVIFSHRAAKCFK